MAFTFKIQGAVCLKSSNGVVEIEMPKVSPVFIDGVIQEQHISQLKSQGFSFNAARRITEAGGEAMYQESILQLLKDALVL